MKIRLIATVGKDRHLATCEFETRLNWVPFKMGVNLEPDEPPIEISQIHFDNKKTRIEHISSGNWRRMIWKAPIFLAVFLIGTAQAQTPQPRNAQGATMSGAANSQQQEMQQQQIQQQQQYMNQQRQEYNNALPPAYRR
jgi:hypothetical protein